MIRVYHNGTMDKLFYLLEHKEQVPAWRIRVTAKAVLAKIIRDLPPSEFTHQLVNLRESIAQ